MIWLAVATSVVLAGFIKGVSGMGLPVVATPILALMLDLPTAIAIIVPATVLSDLPVLYRFRSEWHEARRLRAIVLPAAIGIVIGTRILAAVNPAILRGLLGALVIAFVLVSSTGFLPRLGDEVVRWSSPFVGAAAGVLQGAVGQSGPVISIFFLELGLSRAAFMFVINAYFLVVDSVQFISLAARGVYTPERSEQAAAVVLLAIPTLLLGLRFHDRISDRMFRRVVLAMLALTGLALVVRTMLGG